MIGRHYEIIKSPISIDQDFIDRLQALIDFAREETFRRVALQNNVETSRVKQVAAGIGIGTGGLIDEAIQRDLRSDDRLSFKLKYAGTKEIRADTLAQCVEVLKDEFGVCQCFMMDFGATHSVSIDLDLDTRFNKSTYDIRAERVFSDPLAAKTRELLIESAPSFKLLHSGVLGVIIPLLSSLCIAWIYLWIFWKLQKVLPFTFAQVVPTVGIPFFGALLFLADPILKQYRKTFPFIQFEFGAQKKRRDASKTGTAFLIGALIAPVLLSLAGF